MIIFIMFMMKIARKIKFILISTIALDWTIQYLITIKTKILDYFFSPIFYSCIFKIDFIVTLNNEYQNESNVLSDKTIGHKA